MEIIYQNYDKVKVASKEHFVKKLEAYGSVTKSSFSKESDIDFLVTFKEIPFSKFSKNFFSYHSALELIFKRKIDLSIAEKKNNELFSITLKVI
ncbi:MAG: nucleotidyltransferase domain-containing protein [Bacteroidia bacterium]